MNNIILALFFILLGSCSNPDSSVSPLSHQDKQDINPNPQPQKSITWAEGCDVFGNSPNVIKYCFKQAKGAEGVTLLAFHGMGGNEHDWIGNITKDFQKDPNKIANVVTLSFGPEWSLGQAGKMQALENLLAYLTEQKNIQTDHLILYGMSMGGHNSLLFAKNRPAVKAVAAVCPAILDGDYSLSPPGCWSCPSSNISTLAYMAHYMPDSLFSSIQQIFGVNHQPDFIRSIGFHGQHQQLLKDSQWPNKIFIHANREDHFPSFFQGATHFYEGLQGLQTPPSQLIFKPVSGGHCHDVPLEEIRVFFENQ